MKTFKKSLRTSQSILEEEEEDPGATGLKEEELQAAALIRDSTEIEGEWWTTETYFYLTNVSTDSLFASHLIVQFILWQGVLNKTMITAAIQHPP